MISGAIVANLTWSRRLTDAREETSRLMKADPGSPFGQMGLAQIELVDRRPVEAVRLAEQALASPPIRAGTLGHAYALSGRRADAERELAGLTALVTADSAPAFQIAQSYTGLGNSTQALDWLERAYRERSLWMAWLKVDPMLDSLRDEPRFKALIEKMKF